MRKTMRMQAAAVLCLLGAGTTALVTPAMAAPAERYLHVNVEDATQGESVKVNVPLALAEKILPTINKGDLHNGKVYIHNADVNGVDLRTLLDAVKEAPDNEFVTVKDKDSNVRVAKANGNIIVHVIGTKSNGQNVDVTVPIKIVDALVSTAKNDQFDIAAALQALSDAGDIVLVTVQDSSQKVRVWVDSLNTQN
jgi:hypothetical protein